MRSAARDRGHHSLPTGGDVAYIADAGDGCRFAMPAIAFGGVSKQLIDHPSHQHNGHRLARRLSGVEAVDRDQAIGIGHTHALSMRAQT